MLDALYSALPEKMQPVASAAYNDTVPPFWESYRGFHPRKQSESQFQRDFVATFFDSESEYQRYVTEFREGSASEIRDRAVEEYRKLSGSSKLSGIGLDVGENYYALVRTLEPELIVETGVCNGISTMCILLALNENDRGELHSIDYPYYADESLDEFRKETFDDYGGAAIPSDKEPGWIVPDDLTPRWNLYTGKSQRELPRMLTQFDSIDVFAHDSEHSAPCMLFEFELAWEWLSENGILLSDDITWNDAFETFTAIRDADHGRISRDVGFVRKV